MALWGEDIPAFQPFLRFWLIDPQELDCGSRDAFFECFNPS